MKRLLNLFLVIVFSVYSSAGVVLAATDDDGKKEFSVLAVGDYDYYANLTFEDANYFDDYLMVFTVIRVHHPVIRKTFTLLKDFFKMPQDQARKLYGARG